MIKFMYVQCSADGFESWLCRLLNFVIWSELHYKWELSVLIWKVGGGGRCKDGLLQETKFVKMPGPWSRIASSIALCHPRG